MNMHFTSNMFTKLSRLSGKTPLEIVTKALEEYFYFHGDFIDFINDKPKPKLRHLNAVNNSEKHS